METHTTRDDQTTAKDWLVGLTALALIAFGVPAIAYALPLPAALIVAVVVAIVIARAAVLMGRRAS